MMHFTNIIPPFDDKAEFFAEDALSLSLADKDCFNETALELTLVPEGNPILDKAKILGETFLKYKKELKSRGLRAGILIQATLGHGWVPDSRSSFQKFINSNLEEKYIHCPLDKDFQKYIYDSIHHLALLKPDFFMLDDDFRLFSGLNGCFCPLHIARINEELGTNYSVEEIIEKTKQDKEFYAKFVDIETTTMKELAKIIRRAIDDADPSIPCMYCTCGNPEDLNVAEDIAKIISAKGQACTIRINNGRYMRNNPADFGNWLYFTCHQRYALSSDTEVITEADTFPQNRYATDVACMNANITLALLHGFAGAKLWITRLSNFEPNSGKAYRQCLKENIGLYKFIYNSQPRWIGFNSPMRKPQEICVTGKVTAWGKEVFSLMGIPFRYEYADKGPTMLSGDDVAFLKDEEIKGILSGTVILDGEAGKALAGRGFAHLLGYESLIKPPRRIAKEIFFDTSGVMRSIGCSNRILCFINVDPKAEILSTLHIKDWAFAKESMEFGPGTVLYKNTLGGTVITFSATIGEYSVDSFSLLNESRKLQLCKLIEKLGFATIHYAGDARIICQYGETKDNKKIMYFCNTTNDLLPCIEVASKVFDENSQIFRILSDGKPTPVKIEKSGSHYCICDELKPLETAIFLF
ncbi:MAG: hypothetical protein J6V41_02285 [Kiritimatiellae bacterium]|nr:hypothetical protein [Kiritimatiellia bacterium]